MLAAQDRTLAEASNQNFNQQTKVPAMAGVQQELPGGTQEPVSEQKHTPLGQGTEGIKATPAFFSQFKTGHDKLEAFKTINESSKQQRQLALKQEMRHEDSTDKWLEEFRKEKATAKDSLETGEIGRILEKTGKLDSPAWTFLVKGIKGLTGLPVDILMQSQESRVYEGLNKQYLKPLKEIFGSRPTQFDVQQFLMSIPRLENTPEGREMLRKINDRVYNSKVEKGNLAEELNREYEKNGWSKRDIKAEFERRWDVKGAAMFEDFKKEFVPDSSIGIPANAKPGSFFDIGNMHYAMDNDGQIISAQQYFDKHPDWRGKNG
jgi:hypothetical protein